MSFCLRGDGIPKPVRLFRFGLFARSQFVGEHTPLVSNVSEDKGITAVLFNRFESNDRDNQNFGKSRDAGHPRRGESALAVWALIILNFTLAP